MISSALRGEVVKMALQKAVMTGFGAGLSFAILLGIMDGLSTWVLPVFGIDGQTISEWADTKAVA